MAFQNKPWRTIHHSCAGFNRGRNCHGLGNTQPSLRLIQASITILTSSTASKPTNATSTVFRNPTALICMGGRNS
ncbi:hypothetical protein FOBRF1_000984 [Fusarium oxysporum]